MFANFSASVDILVILLVICPKKGQEMNNDSNNVVRDLISVGKLDASLCRIRAEKKQFESEFTQMRESFLAQENALAVKKKYLAEKQARYVREERLLRDERDKLVGRRKTLETLGSFKLQQAAQREIEHASRQLDVHEEGLIKLLEEIERLEQAVEQEQGQYDKAATAYKTKAREINEGLHVLDKREEDLSAERIQAVQGLDGDLLKAYDRVKERFSADPLASISAENTCSGCFMKIGPQIVVQVSRGQELIKCPGCGRILFLENSKEE